MHDLLNEDDFIQPPHNPWPLFRKFYLFAIVQAVLWQTIISPALTGGASPRVILIYFLLPLITAVWMFAANTKSFLLKRKTKVLALFILLLCFTIPILLIKAVKIIYNPTVYINIYLWEYLSDILFFLFLQSLSCFGLIYIISRVIKSKLKQV